MLINFFCYISSENEVAKNWHKFSKNLLQFKNFEFKKRYLPHKNPM